MEDASRLCNHTIFSEVSDHLIVLSEIKLSVETSRVTFSKRIINHTALQNEFRSYLQNIEDIDNVNTCLENVASKYNEILERCTVTVTKQRGLPWPSG